MIYACHLPSLALFFVFISMRMYGIFAFQRVSSLYLHCRRLASSKASSQTGIGVASSLAENLQTIEIPKEASPKIKSTRKRKKKLQPEEEVTSDEGLLTDPVTTKVEKRKVLEQKLAKRFISASSLPSADMGTIAFSISGEAMALARHRSTRGGVMYNPCTAFQKRFLELARPYLPASPCMGPLEARMLFHLGRPKSQYYSGKNSNVRRPGTSKWHTSRSDLDNLVKFVLDALNGVAYGDDSQVATLTCAKTYTTSPDDTPRIDVYLRPLAEDEEPMTIIPTSNEESKKP